MISFRCFGKEGKPDNCSLAGRVYWFFVYRSEQLELIYRWENSWLFAVYYGVCAVKLS